MTNTPMMNEEAKAATEMLSNMEPNGYWNIGNMLSYRRDGDKQRLVLLHRLDNEVTAGLHAHYKAVLATIGWEVMDSEAEVRDEAELSPEEQEFMHRMRLQEQMMNATCTNPECDTFIAAMDLEDAVWTHLEDSAYTDENGVAQVQEWWSPVVTCFACEEENRLAPDHYAMLAGDDLSNRYKNKAGHIYRVLGRDEVLNKVDSSDLGNLTILGTFCRHSQEMVPPFYRGLITEYTGPTGEEE